MACRTAPGRMTFSNRSGPKWLFKYLYKHEIRVFQAPPSLRLVSSLVVTHLHIPRLGCKTRSHDGEQVHISRYSSTTFIGLRQAHSLCVLSPPLACRAFPLYAPPHPTLLCLRVWNILSPVHLATFPPKGLLPCEPTLRLG